VTDEGTDWTRASLADVTRTDAERAAAEDFVPGQPGD